MSLPTPLRALVSIDPERARGLIRSALMANDGHREQAARALAMTRGPGGGRWLPKRGAYGALWRCIVALDMGEEVRKRWPAPSDPRGPAP